MRVLVTGAAGFLGYHLTIGLLKAGEHVIALVRPSVAASAGGKRRLKLIEAAGAEYPGRLEIVRAELGPQARDVLVMLHPDACVHLAGRSWVRESIGWPEQYVEANLSKTALLLEALREAGTRRVVLASTCMVYGSDAPLPYMEEELGDAPPSPYGATKLAAEMLMNSYASLYEMETVNLRIFSAYGPELRQDCVPHLIASAIQSGKPFTVFGEGDSIRDYIEVDDVVSAFVAALSAHTPQPALNIGSGFGTELATLIRMIEDGLGKKATLVHKPPVPGELHAVIPDITLSIDKLGWEPHCPIEDGIARFCRWAKESGLPA
jgi:UDP-glucuronate 4-epimerase